MLLVIDNFDSFTYNLVQYFAQLGVEQQVYRNNALSVEEALALKPERVMLSPGPCAPDQAGVSLRIIEAFAGKVPLLGVCLGHQCIADHHGGVVERVILAGPRRPVHEQARQRPRVLVLFDVDPAVEVLDAAEGIDELAEARGPEGEREGVDGEVAPPLVVLERPVLDQGLARLAPVALLPRGHELEHERILARALVCEGEADGGGAEVGVDVHGRAAEGLGHGFGEALQMPLDRVNEIMRERTGMGETGESYLVGPEKLMRSDSYLDPENHSVAASFRCLARDRDEIRRTAASKSAS